MALHVFELELAAHVLGEPARDLDAPDVLGDGVVAAGLGDEHPGAALEVVHGQRALHLAREVALEAAEEDAEARHRHLRRRVGGHFEERLRVRDDELRRHIEAREGAAQLALLDHQCQGVAVHEVADALHLRQDQAAARRLLVDGHHEDGEVAGVHEVAEDGGVVDEVRRRRVEQRLAEVEHAAAFVAAVSTGVSLSSCSRGTGAGLSIRSHLLNTTTIGALRSSSSSRMPSS